MRLNIQINSSNFCNIDRDSLINRKDIFHLIFFIFIFIISHLTIVTDKYADNYHFFFNF